MTAGGLVYIFGHIGCHVPHIYEQALEGEDLVKFRSCKISVYIIKFSNRCELTMPLSSAAVGW